MKVSAKKYADALVSSLKGEKDKKVVEERIGNLLKILAKRKQTKILKSFPEIFKAAWYKETGQLEVKLTLPYKPEDQDKLRLVKELGESLDRDIILKVNVDKEVLGGMKLEFEDYVIDGTILRGLEQLKSNLSNN